jgi:hypothetical protein
MRIPDIYADRIRAIDVDAPLTLFSFDRWRDTEHTSQALQERVRNVYNVLGDRFTRRDVVQLYASPELEAVDKFLAAMIWGHESGENGRRDGRGPWKVLQMLDDDTSSRQVLQAIDVSSRSAVAASYASLAGALKRCGPNFFTKHLYFAGKALSIRHFPVIFDNRVAVGISRLAGVSDSVARMISVSTTRKQAAYMAYLDFVHEESDRLQCQPDQIEVFLFEGAGEPDPSLEGTPAAPPKR